MKRLPWILCLIFLGGAFFFYASDQRREKNLSLAQEQVAVMEKAAAEQAKSAPQDANEISMGEKERGELIRLRGEVGQLRREKQKLEQQVQQTMRSQDELLQRQQTQQAQLQQQSQQIVQQTQVQNAAQALHLCINNLRQIDGAKQQWALENKQPADALVVPQQIMPYLKNSTIPVCPSGGTYTLNNVQTPPTCSIAGHALPQ